MPYDFPFDRVIKTSNDAALELNKSVAAELIQKYPEVYDLNSANSSGYFLQQEIGSLDEEFPEKHFRLHADIEDIGFSFEFWKDTMWLELSARGDVSVRFAQVRNYAVFFEQQGFVIYIPPDSTAATLDERIAWHLREYKEWAGFVEHLQNPLGKKRLSDSR